MIKIKRIKLDRIEHSEYGVEHWCKVYTRYRGQFFKTWQLVLADDELNGYQLAYELSKRTKEVKAHVKSVSKIKKFSIFH
ncbi:hypothetical protein KUF97_09515 [Streptococcus equi subsp. zooepidemicus]|uniref:hypothetical protein n=1 Tax=Streptococcus equi TaxID=1336 RepID=UPI001E5DABC0|nr:hypothetical protein [Streptococcus equi]MCD3414342.1 hypothetical protein [Streptococcus equi subsp. zooepidemicus]HEL0787366.1 hypothetical protein [Streptococcus equi subsp. zooepidemicus]